MLEAADRLFRRQGFRTTTVRQIAVEAGVSSGTVMAYGDKDALLVAIFDRWIADVHDHRSQSEPMPGEGDAACQIAELVRPFLGLFDSNLELAREYAAILLRGAHGSAVFQGLALALKGEIQAVFARCGMPAPKADKAAGVVYFAYLGVLMAWASGAFGLDEALEQLKSFVTHIENPQGE